MSEFDKVTRLIDETTMKRIKNEKLDDDKDISDEGIFVSESNGEEDEEEEEEENEFIRQPNTEFEKSLSKIYSVIRHVDDDAQFLCHDFKTLQSKNESTERRITKLQRETEDFKMKLQAFLHSFATTRYSERPAVRRQTSLFALPVSPRIHKTTLNVLLKQNSIEQPVHVNIAVR